MLSKKFNLRCIVCIFAAMLCTLTASAINGVWAGSGTQADPYQIADAADLAKLASDINNDHLNYYGQYFLMTADIDLNGWDAGDGGGWMPMGKPTTGNYYSHLNGTFDGGNHVIKNMTINRPDLSYVGLFGFVGNLGEVKNLGMTDGYINCRSVVGAVVGKNYGGITNCYNTGTIIANASVGGVVGTNGGAVINCHNTGAIMGKSVPNANGGTQGSSIIGGVVGSNGTISNCYNTGAITSTGIGGNIGGIVGSITYTGRITNCYNTGVVQVSVDQIHIGGIVGINGGTVMDSHNTAMVTGGHYVGGIAGVGGTVNAADSIVNCYNTGAITGGYDGYEYHGYDGQGYIGGIVGDLGQERVSKCYNTGTVTCASNYAGGIVGNMGISSTQYFTYIVANCYNIGTVTCTGNYAGGIVGYDSGSPIKNCYSAGTVTGFSNIGGIAGYIDAGYYGYGTIINCYYNTDPFASSDISLSDSTSVGLITAQMVNPDVLTGTMSGLGSAFVKPVYSGAAMAPAAAQSPSLYTYYYPELAVFHNSTDPTIQSDSQISAGFSLDTPLPTAVDVAQIHGLIITSQNSNLTLRSESNNIRQVSVYNLAGQILKTADFNTQSVEIGGFPAGQIILVKVLLNNGQVAVQKVVF